MSSCEGSNSFGPRSKHRSTTGHRGIVKGNRTKCLLDSEKKSEDKKTLVCDANSNQLRSAGIADFDDGVPVPRLSPVVSSLLVAGLAIASYWNGCHGDFVFDDLEAIVKNKDLRPQSPWTDLFHHDFWGDPISSEESHKSYRPVTVLSFRLNYYLAGGLYPWGFHVVNILLHALVSVLVLPVVSALLAREKGAGKREDLLCLAAPKSSLLCAILFAVHPIHTENVSGVVGRADILCALFFFLSFLAYVKVCKNDAAGLSSSHSALFSSAGLLVSMSMCAVSMLCKEPGITVLGVCFVYDVIINCHIHPVPACLAMWESCQRHGLMPSIHRLISARDLQWLRRLAGRQLTVLVSMIILLVFRLSIMGDGVPSFQPVDNPASFADSLWVRVINYSYIYALNVWLLLNPWWLCFDWSMGCVPLIQTPLDYRMVVPIVFWLVIGCLTYSCFSWTDPLERRALTMAMSALIIPFIPASNLLFRVGFVVAERALYLPSLGFCLLVVMGMRQLCIARPNSVKRFVQGMLMVVIACHMTRCIHRNKEWLTEDSLYQSGLRVCPLNAKVHYNIGKSATDLGRPLEAISAYREALRLYPEYDQALNNLGNLLREMNQTEEAESLISQAVTVRPKFAAAWMNLGIVQVALQKYAQAEESYLTALRHRKHYPDCYFNLGNLYLVVGQTDQALSAWLNATSLLNTHAEAWNNALLLLDNLGHYNTAVAVGQEALKFLPEEPSIFYSMGNVLGKLEQFEEAEKMFQKAIRFNPNAASYHGNLGVLYHRWGKLEEALQCYQRSLTLDPKAEVTRANMQKLERTLAQKGTV
ncbi:protein O-mannosyl-transferase TMTC4-like [Diadema setosum]|uniref:protein O-mannosyl-transferase TMTC4-like n=1 Tax=Diadema setosum TaxID=31175 RepID=UPI003B3A6BBD